MQTFMDGIPEKLIQKTKLQEGTLESREWKFDQTKEAYDLLNLP